MSSGIILATEPVSIPLSVQDAERQRFNEKQLLYFTGHSPKEIKALADTKGLPLRRTGAGSGTRYELYVRDWHRWIAALPQD